MRPLAPRLNPRRTGTGRLLLAAVAVFGLAAAQIGVAAWWSDPAHAKGGNSGGGGGNGGGNGNGPGQNNAGGKGVGHGKGKPGQVQSPDAAMQLRDAGSIRPLSELYAAAEKQFRGKVVDAKLIGDVQTGWFYDVRVVTEDGHTHDVSYQATNLALVSIDGEPVE